jgi:hypothetical protein
MVENSGSNRKEDERPIADTSELFRDEAASGSSPPPGGSQSGSAGEYALEPEEAEASPPAAPSGPPVAQPGRRRAEPSAQPVAGADNAYVEQVWTRAAEWGPNLAVLGGVGFVVLLLVYSTSSDPGLAFLILLAGIATLVVLSYPILVTLERPVRMTPEQAVADFYGALSHYVPHYRRMWLILSSAGRRSSSFSTYQGFKNYWKARLDQLKGDHAGTFTPLAFKIEEFKGEKSGGQKASEGTFTIKVFLAGKESEEPIASIRMEASMVRGPDNMWYLNRGTLPAGRTQG